MNVLCMNGNVIRTRGLEFFDLCFIGQIVKIYVNQLRDVRTAFPGLESFLESGRGERFKRDLGDNSSKQYHEGGANME